MPRSPALAVVVAGSLLAALLAGCSDDGLPPAQNVGYRAGDGTLEQTPPQARGEPIDLSGVAADGAGVDLAELRGKVVVLNTWFADCAPCRAEADVLQAVSTDYADRAQFVGINDRDTPNRILAFQESFGVTYPSIVDTDGTAMLALRGVAPRATPTTVVLDAEGRVAAQKSGETDESTLSALIDDALEVS